MSLTASRLSALAVLALPLVSARSLGAQRGGDVTVSRNVRVSTRSTQDVVSESWIAARVGLYSLAGVWAAAVGWSRLQLDEHWFDDVLGGWSAGIAIAIASTACDDSCCRETPGPGLPRP